jgi:hypothetical protein
MHHVGCHVRRERASRASRRPIEEESPVPLSRDHLRAGEPPARGDLGRHLGDHGSGFFWPIIPAAVWGVFLGLNWWNVYRRNDQKPEGPTEAQLRQEMDALRLNELR